MRFILDLLLCEIGTTLAITRKTSGSIITSSGFNTNYTEIETVVNGNIDSDTNIIADGVKAVALNADVVRSGYGLSQHTDGSLQVDPSDTNPSLEISDGGVRVKVDEVINRTSGGLTWGRTGDVILSSNTNTPSGFTDVSSTYSNKFIRINATALSSGGADTHTHGAGSYAGPSHTHTGTTSTYELSGSGIGDIGSSGNSAHRHTFTSDSGGTGAITGTSASSDNVPAYVTLKAYQKS